MVAAVTRNVRRARELPRAELSYFLNSANPKKKPGRDARGTGAWVGPRTITGPSGFRGLILSILIPGETPYAKWLYSVVGKKGEAPSGQGPTE